MLVTIFHEWHLTSSKPASNLRTSTLLESGVTKDKDKSVVFLNDPSDTCSGSDGSCGVVWGEEMPLSSTEMPMPNGLCTWSAREGNCSALWTETSNVI